MKSHITLYRGDSKLIDSFNYNKTNKLCYAGRGIYLTNSRTVANSYRTKGSSAYQHHYPHSLYDGEARDRIHALELAFPNYLCVIKEKELWNFLTDYRTKGKPLSKKLNSVYQTRWSEFMELYQDGRVVANYKTASRVHPRCIVVKMEYEYEVGYISEFSFPIKQFEQSMFNLDRVVDPAFWELMWDNNIDIGSPYDRKDTYICSNLYNNRSLLYGHVLTNRLDQLDSIRDVLKPYGYRGFEYNGGLAIGGCGRHRAFVVWEDEYVNQHFVRRLEDRAAA